MAQLPRKNKLTLSQRRCAELFATQDVHNMTVAQIANEIGVSPRTVFRWKNDPDFIAYQNQVAERAMDDFLNEAYLKLRQLLREGKSEKTQLEAIKLVLQTRGKLKDRQEITVKQDGTLSLEEQEQLIIDMENELLEEPEDFNEN